MNRSLSILIALFLSAFMSSSATANATPDSGWRQYSDTLARVLIAEADASQQDWAAIAWVLEHRREQSGASHASVLKYSATLRQSTERTQQIHTMSLKQKDLPRLRKQQFRNALAFVEAWLAGDILDPCPEATDFYGTIDNEPSWFESVECGSTQNVFGMVAQSH